MRYHALCHVPSLLRLDEVEQGMFGAISVPKREDGVVGEAVGLMYLHVVATVLAIDIHIDGGVNHGVVERGIEECFLVIGAFYLHGAEFFLPLAWLSPGESGRRSYPAVCLQVGQGLRSC